MNTNKNTACRFWNLVTSGKTRYDAFLLVRMGGTGTYKDRSEVTGLPIRRWASSDGSLVLDIRADLSHVCCIKG